MISSLITPLMGVAASRIANAHKESRAKLRAEAKAHAAKMNSTRPRTNPLFHMPPSSLSNKPYQKVKDVITAEETAYMNKKISERRKVNAQFLGLLVVVGAFISLLAWLWSGPPAGGTLSTADFLILMMFLSAKK